MNKAQLQEKLQGFTQEDETIYVELYLQHEDEEGNIHTYLPAAEEKQLSVALGNIVRNQIIGKFFVEHENYKYEVASAHSAEANDIRQVFHVTATQIPKAAIIFEAVTGNKAEDFPSNIELKDIWSYIFKVDCSKGTIYLWKRNYPISVLRKESSYALFFSNSKLSLLDKDLLRLSKHFDVMLIDTELIVLSRTEFEKAFDYVEAMQTAATVNINVIKRAKLFEVEGLEKITSLSQNKRTLRKLLNINPQSKILKKTPVQIARLAKKYKVKFEVSEDKSKLSITSKKSAVAFVELLNDDYLKSEFSDSLYKIKGKSQI